MHHANHFYGHAHIMSRYVGLAEPPRIWGYLQHGWNLHDGFAVGTVFAPRYPLLVWSQACARRGWAAGLRDYITVGAPWLYLLELERQQEWLARPDESAGTIVYPFHGWEGQQVVGSHADYIDEVKSVEGDVPITVCLHWNEYDNPKVRAEYEQAGVRVISHGQRGYLWQGTDVAFLYRQLAEIRRHRRVVSNRMSSAVLYAAAAGTEIGVYGDPMELEGDHAILGGASKPARLWPQMYQTHVPTDFAAAVAHEELGAEHVLPPAEVIDVFGWTDVLPEPLPPTPAPPVLPVVAGGRRRTGSSAGLRAPESAEPVQVAASISAEHLSEEQLDAATDGPQGEPEPAPTPAQQAGQETPAPSTDRAGRARSG